MKRSTSNPNDEDQDRDQQILRRLSIIENRLNSLDQTNAFALRADADKHIKTIEKIFGNSKRKVQVYLAANGTRSVSEIAILLSMKQPNVSVLLSELQYDGLLEIKESYGSEIYYGKKQIDHTLRISVDLMKNYNLDINGLIKYKNK